jgi:hypothetical protein
LLHRAEQAQTTNRLYSSLDEKRGAGQDVRYSLHRELGSDVGSRGDALSNKTALLKKALSGFPAENVTVVTLIAATSSLLATFLLPITEGSKLDLARSKRPVWKFELLPPGACVSEADVVLCIDV